MPALAAAALVAAWEHARSLPAGQRAAALLRAFGKPEQPSVGRRDEALLEVFAENFGHRLDGLARCPACGTDTEINVPIAELTAGMPTPEPVEPLVIDGRTIHWRLLSEADLWAAAECADPNEGALLLLKRCADGADLPERAREQLAERIAAADPYADISFTLACPDCGHRWESALDMAEFVWARLRARAVGLLREVDELARAYGWTEEQILALSQDRRDSYLDLVRHG